MRFSIPYTRNIYNGYGCEILKYKYRRAVSPREWTIFGVFLRSVCPCFSAATSLVPFLWLSLSLRYTHIACVPLASLYSSCTWTLYIIACVNVHVCVLRLVPSLVLHTGIAATGDNIWSRSSDRYSSPRHHPRGS